MDELKNSLRILICEALHLEDVRPSEIGDETPLFGGGLGLDSVDALELAIEIEKRYGVRISQDEKDRAAFATVGSLAGLLKERLGGAKA